MSSSLHNAIAFSMLFIIAIAFEVFITAIAFFLFLGEKRDRPQNIEYFYLSDEWGEKPGPTSN